MRFVSVLALGIVLSLSGIPTNAAPLVTEAHAQHWLKIWQKRLALGDWAISIRLVRSQDLKPDTIGNLRWNSANKTATIRVMDPLDYDLPASEIPGDMEYTVVHELLHLQLAMIPKAPGSKEVEEHAVNRIGDALFLLEKGLRPRAQHAPLLNQSKRTDQPRKQAAPPNNAILNVWYPGR